MHHQDHELGQALPPARLAVEFGDATPSWLAICTAGCVPGVRSQGRSAVVRAAVGSSPRISAPPVARPRALTPQQVEQGIAGMAQRDQVLVELLCYAGLRPGEALALTWDSVRDGLLIVDRSYSYGELKDTKTRRRRTVDLIKPLAADLAAYRPARPAPGALVVESAGGGYVGLAELAAPSLEGSLPRQPV